MIELASFSEFNETHQSFLDQLMESVGIVLEHDRRDDAHRGPAQAVAAADPGAAGAADRAHHQAGRAARTNEELQEKAQLLENEKKQVEAKNLEIEMARRALEEKAEQLALTSKYKSEFLANMSHELRTPLNSLLILSKLLADNPQGNLNEKQVEFARTINSAGSDLLNLINDILDLSKIESGTVSIEVGDMPMAQPQAAHGADLPPARRRQGPRLQRRVRRQAAADHPHRREAASADRPQPAVQRLQVHRRRAASRSAVALRRQAAGAPTTRCSRNADRAIEIAVTDTGIGIPEDKQKLIFEAFQQADGTTSRKYGGTGLGLSISREIARLLGGELQVRSKPGEGSTFTLFVPLEAAPAAAPGDRARRRATTIAARSCRRRCRPGSRSTTTATSWARIRSC